MTAAGMIRRHGDIAGIMRERQLSEPDRKYLERAMSVVPPVADLPIALPAGRRDSYPVDATRMDSIAGDYGVTEACARLVSAVTH